MDKGKEKTRPTASYRRRKHQRSERDLDPEPEPQPTQPSLLYVTRDDLHDPDNTWGADKFFLDENEENQGDGENGQTNFIEDDKGKNEIEGDNSDIPHPPLLDGFNNHVTRYIYNGVEREVKMCHGHVNKLVLWELDLEKDLHHWKGMFKTSKLLSLRTSLYKNPNKNLIAAFIERWHPETNSFHFTFGEMTITLEDVFCITGLRVDGISVLCTRDEKKLETGTYELMELLGLTHAEALKAIEGVRGSSIRLTWLEETFSPMMELDDPLKILYAARAYVLYTFWTTLFADKSGTRVNTS